MSAADPTTPAEPRTRRDVLCGLVVALLAPGALAAACGSDSDSTTGSSGSSSTPTGGSSSTGGAGTSTGAGSSSGLAALADVPEGGGLVVDKPGGGKLLLVRTSTTEVKAYNASCPHQGTTVDPPQGGTITCPNHGSTFNAADGALKGGPATRGLTGVAVKVDGANIVLA